MEKYKVLGIDENASRDEIEIAYINKIEEFNKTIKDKKKLKKYLTLFDKAYREIKKEQYTKEYEETLLIDIKEIKSKEEIDSNIDAYSEGGLVFEEWIDEDTLDYKENVSAKKTKKTGVKSISSKKTRSNKSKSNKDNKRAEKKAKDVEHVKKKRERDKDRNSFIRILRKVLVTPIIMVISIIILFCEVLNVISWIVSKIMIVGSIALASIHGYQIYNGQAIQYKIFILSGCVFILAFCLPTVTKTLSKLLNNVKGKLKVIKG